jgi:hypothetical protein
MHDAKKYQVFLRSVRRLLVTDSVVPRSPILVTLMKKALSSSETRFLQEPHSVTSQKTQFFIVTAVETSNFTAFYFHLIRFEITFAFKLPTILPLGMLRFIMSTVAA